MAKRREFSVTARVTVIASINIAAENFQDAVAAARDLDVTDFVTIDGEYIDGRIQIAQVGKSRYWDLPKDDKE